MRPATDFPPLWLPEDETVAERHASVGPADRVEGWTWKTMLLASILGSRAKTVRRVGLVVAVLCTVALAPTLIGDSGTAILRLAVFQALVLGVLLLATRRVRSVSAGTLAVFWLAGLFIVPLVLTAVDAGLGLVPGADGELQRWVRPVLGLGAGLVPLLAPLVVWPSRFRHPGIADLMLLGAAIGGGYTVLEDGLIDGPIRATLTVGTPMLWIALLGGAIGMMVLERRDAVTITVATVTAAIVIGDATVLGLGALTGIGLLGLLGVAVTADRRRLREVARRDHLFPDPPSSRPGVLVDRYRRLRVGIHTTLAAGGEQWPPVGDVPVAELARAGRSACIEVGRETSRNGWDRDPEDRNGLAHRFFGPNGWTAFTVGSSGVGQAPVRARPEAVPRRFDRVTPMSTPLVASQPEHLGWILAFGAVFTLALLGWLSADPALLDAPTLLGNTSGAPLLRTALGAAGTAGAVIGRSRPNPSQAWELGPPDHHEV